VEFDFRAVCHNWRELPSEKGLTHGGPNRRRVIGSGFHTAEIMFFGSVGLDFANLKELGSKLSSGEVMPRYKKGLRGRADAGIQRVGKIEAEIVQMATIPHVNVAFGNLPENLEKPGDEVSVPRETLARLLDLYISCWDFDEDWYLANYADVQEAVGQGKFASGWAHFRTIGYLEGRLGHQPMVDGEWYVNTYPDIAQAILDGKIKNAADHYIQHGYKEGRLPHDPGIHPKWYAPRYLPSVDPNSADQDVLLEHFLRSGYRQLAVPIPPR